MRGLIFSVGRMESSSNHSSPNSKEETASKLRTEGLPGEVLSYATDDPGGSFDEDDDDPPEMVERESDEESVDSDDESVISDTEPEPQCTVLTTRHRANDYSNSESTNTSKHASSESRCLALPTKIKVETHTLSVSANSLKHTVPGGLLDSGVLE